MTNEANTPVWQWPYSAFGSNKPTGVLKGAPNPKAAITNKPVQLKATTATEMNLRFPGQADDAEAGLIYNYFRSYDAKNGAYTQGDPIGLDGGLNRFGYTGADPLGAFDSDGLTKGDPKDQSKPITPLPLYGGRPPPNVNNPNTIVVPIPMLGGGKGGRGGRSAVGGPVCPPIPIDRATGQQIGRVIVDSKGNAMIEPVGGSTVPAGKGGIDTHTLYPNGSNYQRNNPSGHGNNPTPHGHGHLPGTGPGMKGQGPSIDPQGNRVPWNSPAAHWPTN